MKIGITGAFGFLGSNLTAHLLKNNHTKDSIIAFFSNTKDNPVFRSLDVSSRQMDIRNYKDVLEKTSDLDILFHFAGKVGYRKIDAKSIWETNVHGTRNIFEASLQNKIQKIIYISSINVLGAVPNQSLVAEEQNSVYDKKAGNPNMISSPEMAFNFIDRSLSGDFDFLTKSKVPYFDSKLAAYELAKKYMAEKDLPIITVFPGTAVGPGDIHKDISELIERVYNNSIIFTFTGGTSFVDVRDCAEGIYLCMKKGDIHQSYIISGIDEYNLSYKEFMQQIAKAAVLNNIKARSGFIKVPHIVAIVISKIGEIINPRSMLGSALVHSGKMIHRFSSLKAMNKLGYIPNFDLTQSIQSCYKFLQDMEKKKG